MKPRIYIAFIILVSLGACGLRGQAPVASQGGVQDQPTNPEPPNPTLKPNPIDTLRSFQPGEDEEYRLGRGDEITVDFAGRPDLTAKLVIGPDGRITLPLAGDVTMDGLTRMEAAKAIDAVLAAILREPDVAGDGHQVHRKQDSGAGRGG